jgi:hypothetical protein
MMIDTLSERHAFLRVVLNVAFTTARGIGGPACCADAVTADRSCVRHALRRHPLDHDLGNIQDPLLALLAAFGKNGAAPVDANAVGEVCFTLPEATALGDPRGEV